MYTVYILYSSSRDRYYVGQTEDLPKRIARHNSGGSPATRSGRPWVVQYHAEYSTRGEAVRAERHIKRQKSRGYIERLIGDDPDVG